MLTTKMAQTATNIDVTGQALSPTFCLSPTSITKVDDAVMSCFGNSFLGKDRSKIHVDCEDEK